METSSYFLNRASVRNYSDKPVSASLLREIIVEAMHAPTCGNMQLYTVIATQDPEKKIALAKQHFNQPAAATAPLLLTVCADFNRFTRWCKLSKADPGYDNFHSFVVAMTDAVIMAQQICTVAELKGLGSCFLGTVNYNAKEISNMLALPELVVPVAALSLGYPEGKPERVERLPVEAVLHMEEYRNDSDEKIMQLFEVKDNFPANMEFAKQNGKETLAQVYTDIRYPRNVNEDVSLSYSELIVEKGFCSY